MLENDRAKADGLRSNGFVKRTQGTEENEILQDEYL